MRSLSSIFSSDTLAASLRPTAAVVFALAICVAFRLVLGWLGPGFTGLFGYWLVDTDMGFAQVQMDRESVDGKPRCLVIGSSRVGLGIHTPTLADDLGHDATARDADVSHFTVYVIGRIVDSPAGYSQHACGYPLAP